MKTTVCDDILQTFQADILLTKNWQQTKDQHDKSELTSMLKSEKQHSWFHKKQTKVC